jgi:ABC-type nickel/cobalt efflux system permease component RcnA
VGTTLWLTFLIIAIILLRKLIKRKIKDTAHHYKFQKLIELFGIFLIVVVILLSFILDNFEDYIIIIGFYTAGIALLSQN